jgi:hypothetical protein
VPRVDCSHNRLKVIYLCQGEIDLSVNIIVHETNYNNIFQRKYESEKNNTIHYLICIAS